MTNEFKQGDKVHHAGERWTVDQAYAGGLLLLKHGRIKSISVTVDAADVTRTKRRAKAGEVAGG